MLATFGLQRLESSLDEDTVCSASDVADFLDQAEADDVNTLAREGMSRALDGKFISDWANVINSLTAELRPQRASFLRASTLQPKHHLLVDQLATVDRPADNTVARPA